MIRVAFKPTATIRKEQQTIDSDGKATTLAGKGRHDPGVLPRAVPMVEAMVALVLADHLLRQQGQCSFGEHQDQVRSNGAHCCAAVGAGRRASSSGCAPVRVREQAFAWPSLG